MPRIFDNIELQMLPALKDTLALSHRADFCVGYFNLRGWQHLDLLIEPWPGGEHACCRLLVGMQSLPQDELKKAYRLIRTDEGMDQSSALKIKKRMAEEFRDQLMFGAPTDKDEKALRRLSRQLRSGKLVTKLYLRHTLHAKLYLLYREDPNNPITGFLGSSNLTFAGLSKQGELNVDVLDHDACDKLQRWFQDRWQDRWCLDISEELADIIDESWARDEELPPYYIYLKMAYHLSQEARAGLTEFRLPREFEDTLFDFQKAAVKVAAHHLNKRGGVIIGDVVGLGKTLMATALARIFEDDHGLETLIICPKNLVGMWEDYAARYRLHPKVVSISRVDRELPELRRYRLVLIDESHNLRNRDGVRYRVIHEYIEKNDSKCILLSATPYNKTYLDLANQLRLFIKEDEDIGMRPEELLREMGEIEFSRRHQCPVRSLAAFEKSEYPDDWRELMRLYLVRRTRTFIMDNYAETDPSNDRKFLTFADGSRSYFPQRLPRTVKFTIDDHDPDDPYARLYAPQIVDAINGLALPRYGLGNYEHPDPETPATQHEDSQLQNLSRAGKRLMGFCRTNLFKRLESGGDAFILSIERHILRNFIFLHAIENNLPLPIGTQSAEMLDTRFTDADADSPGMLVDIFDEDASDQESVHINRITDAGVFRSTAASLYDQYAGKFKRRFKWIRSSLFKPDLADKLGEDCDALMEVLARCGNWAAEHDAKLQQLVHLLTEQHPKDKVLVFTQFSDTAQYLEKHLTAVGLTHIAAVTGDSDNPTALAWRFSPDSNGKRHKVSPDEELRILIATDVLSEGQNLQDCSVIVNYDLPWAIIRLIQRAGRVDRIGQKAEDIHCYTFLPADGVERIIRLRARVHQRLQQNAEVVGTDETFFEDTSEQGILNLYNEKSGVLDGDADGEVDLASQAYEIWNQAVKRDEKLKSIIPELPNVVYSTRAMIPEKDRPEGVLAYVQSDAGHDALAWVDKQGETVTQSQFAILRAASCEPDTPAIPRHARHHELVEQGVRLIAEEEKFIGGGLGRPSGARYKTYERLKRHAEEVKDTLFDTPALSKAIEDVYRYPLKRYAVDSLNRQLRSGISDADLAQLVINLREDDRLCIIHEEEISHEPRIICSLGLFERTEECE